MEPRGQLWFQLEQVCDDFKEFSGLSKKEALEVLVTVFTNMLAEQQAELDRVAVEGQPGQ
jgi:hypothetical protein